MDRCLPRTEEDDKLDTIIIHKPCTWPSSPRVLRSSVVRVSDGCSERHRFKSYRRLRYFLCPMARDTLITSFLISSLSFKLTIFLYISQTHT